MQRSLRGVLVICVVSLIARGAPAQEVVVGTLVKTGLETPHPYPTSGTPRLRRSWTDEVAYSGAAYIAVHFARFQLAPGDIVVVRSPDSEQLWTYSGLGKRGLGQSEGGFFAAHIKGERAIVELYTAGFESNYGYRIDYFGRGYDRDEIERLGPRDAPPPDPPNMDKSVCGADDTREAKCYLESEPQIYDASRAIVRLLIDGSILCTGWLVGCEGHVLTAEHCIGSQTDADNTDFELMAEGATCDTDCDATLGCPGVVEASGGTLVAVDALLDYALIFPDTSTGSGTDLPTTYGFLRLRDSGAVIGERIYIPQHPGGWGKRLAVESSYPGEVDGVAHVVSLSEVSCTSGGLPEVGYWADVDAASGAPVLGYADHQVVALHRCGGTAACASGDPESDDPNRGVPIEAVIADLETELPACSICEPPEPPPGLTATPSGDNQIELAWNTSAGATSYNVYRAVGACPQGSPELIAPGLSGTTYSDTAVSGATTYAYQITAVDAVGCESPPGDCADAEATGLCTRAPTFGGLESVASPGTPVCAIDLGWSPAIVHCGSSAFYNVHRSEVPGFTPDTSTELATCLSATSFTDASSEPGTEYFYIVRAEDDSGNGSGACAGGNVEGNTAELAGTATGPDTEVFADAMEDGDRRWVVGAGPNDGGATSPWILVDSDSQTPTHAWFVADEPIVKDQVLATSDALSIPPEESTILEFWHRFSTEATFDGGVLEYSTDGGGSWLDILSGEAGRFLEGGYNSVLDTGFDNPLPGRSAWSGESGDWVRVTVDLDDFGGQSIRLRWRLGCDASEALTGWWLDDVRVFFGGSCAEPVIFMDGFESGDIGAWSN